MQTERSQLGSTLAIHARNADDSIGEKLGRGRIIHPQLVQVLPPLDAELTAVAHRSEEFLLVDKGKGHSETSTYRVLRIRPGLTSFAEAAEIVAQEQPDVPLAKASSEQWVAFETADELVESADDDGRLVAMASPWWCRIICISACTTC